MRQLLVLAPLFLVSSFAHAGNDTKALAPHESMQASLQAFRSNDLRSFLLATLGEEQVAELKSAWNTARRARPDPAQDAQFTQAMEMLTARGAEDALFAAVGPKLAELEPQIAMMVGMFNGVGRSVVMEDPSLTAQEKRNATKMLDAMGRILMENDVTDPQLAKRSIGILCTAARRLGVRTLSDVHALSFEQLLAKGGVVLAASKDVLEIYGLPVDEWLASVKVETVRESADEATIRVSYAVLGLQQSAEHVMVRSGNGWIRKEAVGLLDTRL